MKKKIELFELFKMLDLNHEQFDQNEKIMNFVNPGCDDIILCDNQIMTFYFYVEIKGQNSWYLLQISYT